MPDLQAYGVPTLGRCQPTRWLWRRGLGMSQRLGIPLWTSAVMRKVPVLGTDQS